MGSVKSNDLRESGTHGVGDGARRVRLALPSAAEEDATALLSVVGASFLLRLRLGVGRWESAEVSGAAVAVDGPATLDGPASAVLRGTSEIEPAETAAEAEGDGAVMAGAATLTGRKEHLLACRFRLDNTPNRRPHVSQANAIGRLGQVSPYPTCADNITFFASMDKEMLKCGKLRRRHGGE